MPKRNMIRNVQTQYIRDRAQQIGLGMNKLCALLGKTDNYINSIGRNGLPEDLLPVLAHWLKIKTDDANLFVGGGRQ